MELKELGIEKKKWNDFKEGKILLFGGFGMLNKLVYVKEYEGIAIVTINNLPMNILSKDVIDQLTKIMQDLEIRKDIRAIIFTSSGDETYIAGGNIKEFINWVGRGEKLAEEKSKWLQYPLNLIDGFSKPTIAVMDGLTLGGGCELALACDLRIAEKQVKIGLPEIKLGLFPGAGGTQRLPRLIGEGRAKEMMFTGELITAEKAFDIGLVSLVVSQGEAKNEAYELAIKLSTYSSPALSLMKKSISDGRNTTLSYGLENEAVNFGKVFQTEDVREGITAFIEKRNPIFTHK